MEEVVNKMVSFTSPLVWVGFSHRGECFDRMSGVPILEISLCAGCLLSTVDKY